MVHKVQRACDLSPRVRTAALHMHPLTWELKLNASDPATGVSYEDVIRVKNYSEYIAPSRAGQRRCRTRTSLTVRRTLGRWGWTD
jgi:hypothetical protein